MIFSIICAVFMVLFWRHAENAFEAGNQYVGWLYISLSAMNGALLAVEIL
jgi:hypothetical protein